MVGGSRWAFGVSFGLGVLLLALVVVWLAMWDETVTLLPPVSGDQAIRERSIVEVWRDWHTGGWIGPAEGIAVGVLLGVPCLAAVAAWMYLPSVHRGGSAWQSFKRSYGAVASGVGLLVMGTALVGILVELADHMRIRNLNDPSAVGVILFLSGLAAILLGSCLLFYWLGRAGLAVAGAKAAVELPPRCEGCGYDLTHRPVEDRCPECGSSISASLTPGVRRPGCAWQTRLINTFWFSTSVAVVFAPTRFYRSLMLRRPEREYRQFAMWHYPAILGLATVWGIIIRSITHAVNAPILPFFFGFSAALAGWCVHRLVGAAMTSWAIFRGTLPDVTWAAKVMAYETSFLWVFCLYDGLLFSSFSIFGNWISAHAFRVMIGNQFGYPAEPFAVLIGNAAIIAAWMWRYGVAFRCVRWSNF